MFRFVIIWVTELTVLLCRKYCELELWPFLWTYPLIFTAKFEKCFFFLKVTVGDLGCKYMVFVSHSTSDGTIKCVSISTEAF